MSLAQGNNTPTRPRIEPGSPDPESDALTTRPVRPPHLKKRLKFAYKAASKEDVDKVVIIKQFMLRVRESQLLPGDRVLFRNFGVIGKRIAERLEKEVYLVEDQKIKAFLVTCLNRNMVEKGR